MAETAPYWIATGWWAEVVFVLTNVLLFVPLLVLILWGDAWQARHKGERMDGYDL